MSSGTSGPEESLDVAARPTGEVVAELVADDVAGGADRAQQRQRERARPDAGLEHPGAREHVGQHQDRAEVLRVDHLRAARHLEHVLGERRAHRDEARVAGGAHGDAVGLADDVVVRQHAGVGVELAAVGEGDEVATPLGVDQQHAVAGGERRGPRQRTSSAGRRGSVSTSSIAPTWDRSRQNAQTSPGVGDAADAALPQLVALVVGIAREALVAALEEAEQERRLRSGRAVLERVEHLLVPEVPVAGGHRALLDLVVDALEHAVGRGLALPEPHERLDLAHEPRRRGQHRVLAAEVAGRPSAARCRAGPRLRRRGCGRSRRRRSRARARSS